MKEIRQKKDKGVSAIIATILLIAITVVLAATLVTILGGFTHGVSNSVVSVGATTQEVNGTSSLPSGSQYSFSYTVYFNVSSSSSSISTSHLLVSINGASNGTFSTFLPAHNPTTLTGGKHFQFTTHAPTPVTSFELIYQGNVIYNSGTISITS